LALAVGAVFALDSFGRDHYASGLFAKPLAWGLGTALVGFAYALLIELGFVIGRVSGRIRV
jgi:hypothetical protein